MYLADTPPLFQKSGYGRIGRYGDLGYEGKTVRVHGQTFRKAISAHAPSVLVFELDAAYSRFRCKVALNDDSHGSHANFRILADGWEIASQSAVTSGEAPREIDISFGPIHRLGLVTETTQWSHCHSVWLDPELTVGSPPQASPRLKDCLRRVEFIPPENPPRLQNCIATVASVGFAGLLYELLSSVRKSVTADYLLAAVVVDDDPDCVRVAQLHGATVVRARSLAPRDQTIKAALYSVAKLLPAQRYLCLDVDTLVLDDLQPIFFALDACDSNSILVCRHSYLRNNSLLEALCTHYEGRPQDLSLLLSHPKNEGQYGLLVNDGVFAGSRTALLALDTTISLMSGAPAWVDHLPHHHWRNQFIFNLALAHLDCAGEMSPLYNLQLHMNEVELQLQSSKPRALWQGRPAHILHFCGWGRNKCRELRKLFSEPGCGVWP